jgi:acetyl esterase/lipase
MASIVRFFAVVVLLSLSLRPSAAQTRVQNIVYTTDAVGSHRGDLYEPQGNGPFAAIVFLHGGSWRSGSKREFKRMGTDLSRDGYVSFSVDYDLKAGSFPVSWNEARIAVQFLRSHATDYRIDPTRIVIAGSSAGGELAALVALAPQGPASLQPDAPAVRVSGAFILNGVYDLCFPAGVIKRYLGGDCSSRKDLFADASPVHHVHPGAPPFFVGHGTRDHVVPYAAADIFMDALRKAQVSVTPCVAEGGPHMYWTKSEYYSQNLAAVEKFLAGIVGKPA